MLANITLINTEYPFKNSHFINNKQIKSEQGWDKKINKIYQ